MAETKKDSGMLMKTLAYGATDESRALLKKYNKPDARDHQDLVICLANLYTSVPDKRQLEKELAEIHPHKDFILKYNRDTIEPISLDEANHELKSNCSGGCPRMSSADGQQPKNIFQDKTVVIVSMLSAVALIGLYLNYKKIK